MRMHLSLSYPCLTAQTDSQEERSMHQVDATAISHTVRHKMLQQPPPWLWPCRRPVLPAALKGPPRCQQARHQRSSLHHSAACQAAGALHMSSMPASAILQHLQDCCAQAA